jgi:hypothetical protein
MHGQSITKFTSKELKKCMDNQPYYKKVYSEVVTYFADTSI